ncbi:MAG: hypothetical protein OXC91_05465 [Rhodobacteraceae bacterium]|nr:hypothetical protein [Paracoccaceae bacterium]
MCLVDRHQTPSALKAAFTAFLDQARPRRADLVLPSAPHHMLLVSPTFTREQHEHHAASGLRTLDIRSMAQLCGMPPPSPMPISAAPERA